MFVGKTGAYPSVEYLSGARAASYACDSDVGCTFDYATAKQTPFDNGQQNECPFCCRFAQGAACVAVAGVTCSPST